MRFHIVAAAIALGLGLTTAGPGLAQARARYCAYAADAKAGSGVLVVEIFTSGKDVGSEFYNSLRPGAAKLFSSDGASTRLTADGVLHARFWDNWGAPGQATYRRSGDRLDAEFIRLGEPLRRDPRTSGNYGRFQLAKSACRAPEAVEMFFPGPITDEDFDDWRYRAASEGVGPVAEMVQWGNIIERPPATVFKVTCKQDLGALEVEYFPGEDPRRWIRDPHILDLDLILRDPGTGKETRHTMPGRAKRRAVVGRLKLSPRLVSDIQTKAISFYGENGPSNESYGGKSVALRRVVRECGEASRPPKA